MGGMLKGSPVPQRIGWPVPLEERIRDNSWFLGWKESLKQPTGALTGLSSEMSCFIFPKSSLYIKNMGYIMRSAKCFAFCN